jgi:hypothetical protein
MNVSVKSIVGQTLKEGFGKITEAFFSEEKGRFFRSEDRPKKNSFQPISWFLKMTTSKSSPKQKGRIRKKLDRVSGLFRKQKE